MRRWQHLGRVKEIYNQEGLIRAVKYDAEITFWEGVDLLPWIALPITGPILGCYFLYEAIGDFREARKRDKEN